jgi:hypothetical protein
MTYHDGEHMLLDGKRAVIARCVTLAHVRTGRHSDRPGPRLEGGFPPLCGVAPELDNPWLLVLDIEGDDYRTTVLALPAGGSLWRVGWDK